LNPTHSTPKPLDHVSVTTSTINGSLYPVGSKSLGANRYPPSKKHDTIATKVERLIMFPRIKAVRHIEAYQLELTFTTGETAELDLRNRIVGRGGVFGPLEDIDYFKQVQVDPEIGSLVWPNEVDFCPDVLYSEATGKPLPEFQQPPRMLPNNKARISQSQVTVFPGAAGGQPVVLDLG
jgi:hypothetical protein